MILPKPDEKDIPRPAAKRITEARCSSRPDYVIALACKAPASAAAPARQARSKQATVSTCAVNGRRLKALSAARRSVPRAVSRAASPSLYAAMPDDQTLLRLLINFFFLQQNWNFTVMALSNGPFWSLGFEFWYYVIFGAWVLLKGRTRIIGTTLACLAAGPRILAAFPVWLLGAAAFRMGLNWAPSRRLATVLFVVSSGAVVTILALGNPLVPVRGAM